MRRKSDAADPSFAMLDLPHSSLLGGEAASENECWPAIRDCPVGCRACHSRPSPPYLGQCLHLRTRFPCGCPTFPCGCPTCSRLRPHRLGARDRTHALVRHSTYPGVGYCTTAISLLSSPQGLPFLPSTRPQALLGILLLDVGGWGAVPVTVPVWPAGAYPVHCVQAAVSLCFLPPCLTR